MSYSTGMRWWNITLVQSISSSRAVITESPSTRSILINWLDLHHNTSMNTNSTLMTHQEMVIRMLKNPKVSEELARLNKNELADLDKKLSKQNSKETDK